MPSGWYDFSVYIEPMTAPTTGIDARTHLGEARARQPMARRPRMKPLLSDLRAHVDLIRGSLVGLTMVSISAVHVYLGPLKYTRPAFTLLALAVLLAVLRPKSVAWGNIRRAWPAMAVAFLFVIALGSTVFGISFGGSARYIIDGYGRVLLVFVLMVIVIRRPQDIAVQMWGYVLSVGVLAILAKTVFGFETTDTGLGRVEGGATMWDGNDLGMVSLLGLPLSLLLFFHSGRLGKVASGLVLIGIPLVIAMTGSRGAMIGLVVVGIAIFFSLTQISIAKRGSVVGVVVLVLMASASDEYWAQMRTLLEPSKDYNVSDDYGRLGIAKRGMGYMLRRPLFGVGIGNFPRAEGTMSPISNAWGGEGVARWVAAHNTYVQVGAELGVFALGTWLTLLFGGSFGLWWFRRRIPKEWSRQSPERRFLRDAALYLPASYLAFAVTSFFLSHGFTPPIYILISFHAGLIVLIRKELRADKLARLTAAGQLGPTGRSARATVAAPLIAP